MFDCKAYAFEQEIYSDFKMLNLESSKVSWVESHCGLHESIRCAAQKFLCRTTRCKGVVYKLQAAQRLCSSFMINTVHGHIKNATPAPPPKQQVDASLNQCLIHESTKGSTTGIQKKWNGRHWQHNANLSNPMGYQNRCDYITDGQQTLALSVFAFHASICMIWR